MKKGIFGIIALILLFSACASSSTTNVNVRSNVALGTDELDSAIREASNEINSKVSAGSFIGIISIQSASTALSEYVIDEIIGNAVKDGNFTVLDRQRLDQIRQEQNFQLSGEVDDDFALSIGRLIGIQTIITGTVSPLGNRYRITIRALNVQTGAVQVQFNKNIDAGETIVALMQNSSGGTAIPQTQTPIQPTSMAQTQTPAQTAAIANGTYIFYPRPQAHKGGVDQNIYVEKIVVRSGYFTVYMTETARGSGSWSGSGALGWNLNPHTSYWARCMLQDLDRPSRIFNPINSNSNNRFYTFENITGRRFRFWNEGNTPHSVFEEIDLDKAEFEP